MLVPGGDYLVAVVTILIPEFDLVILCVNTHTIIPGKCGQMWPIVVSCGQNVVKNQ